MSDSTIRTMSLDEIDIVSGGVSYDQAYNDFQEGGELLGAGAGKLVASAWTGIALTPALIADSLGLGTSLPGGLPELP
ncbi:hypothetical protein [Halomonas elongata]|uniref:Uncharacterized protein n=2 Tax=Halomonas elongata TaxID=2746 RepID=A0A1B8P4G2_HALEL|nr:hypothetical protein [Halomonas elongata]MBW5798655.1 hypothetical protein [Halomonas elongata]MDL4862894.1 hypothetical protein [Halomonas elongata]OBX37119.1 hypothetical protein A8U91_01468 [Halomonas elongata]RAW06754.1 hypothetical protein DKQ62_12350 [Halomonas elongata]WBF19173.1 hypothetical protein LM502_05655 [Halomonas elongata]